MTTTDDPTTGTDTELTFPTIISVDDHVVEPPNLWIDRLPRRFLDRAPHVVRQRIAPISRPTVDFATDLDEHGQWADVWCYEDRKLPLLLLSTAVGHPHEHLDFRTVTFDEMRPSCYDPVARLADMDVAGIEASLCFPNLEPVRFCGQGFLEAKDKELALLCVRAYNDYILDEWCASSGGRLIPCGIIPLWDPQLAAAEVRRTAERGMRGICFSEAPAHLGLPSIHTDHWDPVWRACEDTRTVVMIHVGSSSRIGMPSADAPAVMSTPLITLNAETALVDWMFAGVFVDFPDLQVCFAECQIGWIPYFLQICDDMWENHGGLANQMKHPEIRPSDAYRSNMHVSFFNDPIGLRLLDVVGADRVLCETDFPHSQTTWPTSRATMQEQADAAGIDAVSAEKIARGNARRLFRLD